VIDNNSTNINKPNSLLYFKSLNAKKVKTYGVRNSGPDIGQTHTCGGDAPVNGNLTNLS